MHYDVRVGRVTGGVYYTEVAELGRRVRPAFVFMSLPRNENAALFTYYARIHHTVKPYVSDGI